MVCEVVSRVLGPVGTWAWALPGLGRSAPERISPHSLRTTLLCVARIPDDDHRQRAGSSPGEGSPLGRARSSGGFARWAIVDEHEAARTCCELSRRLDAVERGWFLA